MTYKPTRQQIIEVFNNSLLYEILFTFGVPIHHTSDYCNWESVNFTRMAHARLLYCFLETPIANRRKDDVLSEDFGYPAAKIPLPPDDEERLNKDLMHLTYSRLRHTPTTRPWPDSILANLQDPIVGFMRHVESQADLFPDTSLTQLWREVIRILTSGKQMVIQAPCNGQSPLAYCVATGADLPSGKAALTRFGQPF